MTTTPDGPDRSSATLPPAPWILLDRGTADHITIALERLTHWLNTGPARPIASCALALSLGETDDPITIANWTDALAARLQSITQDSDNPNYLDQPTGPAKHHPETN